MCSGKQAPSSFALEFIGVARVKLRPSYPCSISACVRTPRLLAFVVMNPISVVLANPRCPSAMIQHSLLPPHLADWFLFVVKASM